MSFNGRRTFISISITHTHATIILLIFPLFRPKILCVRRVHWVNIRFFCCVCAAAVDDVFFWKLACYCVVRARVQKLCTIVYAHEGGGFVCGAAAMDIFFSFLDLSCFVGLNIYRTRRRGGAQVYFPCIIYAIQPLKLDLYFCSVWRCGTDARHLLAALREHQRMYSTVERERNFETNCEWQKLWNIVSHTHTYT